MFAKPLIALLLLSPLAAGCAGSIQVLAPTAGCSSLIPAGWTKPVPSAALPPADAVEADWQVFGIEQTGRPRGGPIRQTGVRFRRQFVSQGVHL